MGENHVIAKPGKLSYLGIPRYQQLLDLTIGDLIRIAAEKYGNIPAIIVPWKGEFCYKELDKQTLLIGSGLVEIGLVKGNTVITRAENSMELYLIRLACMRMGIIIADTCPEISSDDFMHCATVVRPHCLILGNESISGESFYEEALTYLPELKEPLSPQYIKFGALPNLTTILNLGFDLKHGTISFDSLCEKGRSSSVKRALEQEAAVQFHDICLIRFTSGTTGRPKAVSFKHHGLLNEASFVGELNSYTSKDRICLGYSVCAAIMNSRIILPALFCGSAVVMVNGYHNITDVIRAVSLEKCTCFGLARIGFRQMMDDPILSSHPMNYLRTVFIASEFTSSHFIQEIKDKLGVPFVANSIGMTEVGLVLHSLPTDSHTLQSSTLGYPSPLIEVKLIDVAERVVPIGVEGELCVRGICVVKGIFGVPELDSDGWYHTGDLMVMLETGHCQGIGRINDVISIERHKVNPRQVEECLEKHPKIKEAHVFKIRTAGQVEHVGAWIALGPKEIMTVEDVQEHCQNKLPLFKIPKYINFVDDITRNSRGKVPKIKLEEKTKELFNL